MVQAGQVWEDLDPRADGRRVQVLSVGMDHALVRVVSHPGRAHAVGREVRIKLARFEPGSRGYRRVAPQRFTEQNGRILDSGSVVATVNGLTPRQRSAVLAALEVCP